MVVTVTNLDTQGTRTYTCSPREAVIAAHAQSRNDWNTWQYKERYSDLVKEAGSHVTCGDWIARKDGRDG